jgi:hypothetical protein
VRPIAARVLACTLGGCWPERCESRTVQAEWQAQLTLDARAGAAVLADAVARSS